jgi:hypothetical protein
MNWSIIGHVIATADTKIVATAARTAGQHTNGRNVKLACIGFSAADPVVQSLGERFKVGLEGSIVIGSLVSQSDNALTEELERQGLAEPRLILVARVVWGRRRSASMWGEYALVGCGG